MTTTAEIARSHGHTGPIACEDCGTVRNLHYGSWFDPKTQESGDFLQCCTCGIKAGDPVSIHAECEPDDEPEPEAVDVPEPKVRVIHSPSGWTLPDYSDLADCTSNFHRELDGHPACADTPVWKVVEDHGMHLTIGFFCDADLPDQHRTPAA